MEPCVFRVPFPSFYKDMDEPSLLANVMSFFSPVATPTPLPRNAANSFDRSVVDEAADMIRRLDFVPFSDPQQMRNYVTNILLKIAAEGKSEASRLRAVEMLGKMKDVSLFEERSTVLVEHMTTEEIKMQLAAKVARLREKTIDAEVVEPTKEKP